MSIQLQKLHVLALLVSSSAVYSAPLRADTPPLEIFAVSDAVRVFEDGYGLTNCNPQKAVNVFGLRNETISAQCVVRAGRDLPDLSVSISPLAREGGGSIPPDHVTWTFVTGINVLTNTPKLRKEDLTRPAPARFPDCLSEDRQCAVTKGNLKAVYLTVGIPAGAEPGEYRGTVSAKAGGDSVSLPVTLNVYPLTLPDTRHVKVTEWFSTGKFKKFHGVDSDQSDRYWQILRAYAKNMAEHRQNMFEVSLGLIKSTMAADGKLRFDFSDFDRFAQVFWDTGKMDAMETGAVARHVPGGWSSTEIALSDFTVRQEADGKTKRLRGEEYLPQFLPAFVEHLRQKKWLDKTLLHICDEPANHNVVLWRKASDFVGRCAPELRRIDAIESPHFGDSLEVWVPKLDHLAAWQGAYEEAQRRGKELWFYTVGIYQSGSLMNKTVDVPLIDTRLMHWLNYRYDLKGYLHWGGNHWTDDPWNAPGLHRGDGWHVYPKKDGLLNSLRWEQMRNGLQDCECLYLLEDKIRQIRATLCPEAVEIIDPRRRSVEIASGVVSTYTCFSRDPETLYAARRQAIEETIGLDRSPRIILETEPPEHSVFPNNCAVDVHGWAEPGTHLKINGHETTVGSNGVFFARANVMKSGGKVTFEAENAKGRKMFNRQFRLQFQP